jgi:CheY-like chemotaxis protein
MEPLAGARVLVVEDNELNQELCCELLQKAGVDVVVAENGKVALEALDANPNFDGVLMDCQMPVMDGYEATRRLRLDPRFAELPVLAMTANAMRGDKEAALAAGMNDHIAKPLDVVTMFTTMARWIRPKVPASGAQRAGVAGDVDVDGVDPSGLPKLAGIDTALGLRRMGGDLGLYRRMLKRFAEGQAHFAAEFMIARQDSDAAVAVRAAHTLRGLAGNIGATRLHLAAEALERTLKQGADESVIRHQYEDVCLELRRVLVALEELTVASEAPDALAREPRGRDAVVVDPARLGELVARLEVSLEGYDLEADALARELVSLLREPEASVALGRALKSIEAYDFEGALVEVREIRAALVVGTPREG